MAKKIILDTDPGVDDAMAIFLALASPEIDLIGLTTVYGNAEVEITTRNALLLLEIAGRTDLPVIKGAAAPMERLFSGPVPQVHGHNGLGDAPLAAVKSEPLSGEAADWMYQQVSNAPGEVTILAVGPVTNLAIALKRYPDLPKLVQDVVVMGGNAIIPGNITPAAEANIFNDPEGADLVFGSAWSVSMVGLDVTHKVNLKDRQIKQITGVKKKPNQFLLDALPVYQGFFEATNGIDGMYLHDPTAVMYIVAPELFETQKCPLRVETESMSRGKTWPHFGDTDVQMPEAWQNRPDVAICMEVDDQAVIGAVLERFS